jgi:hypothetical protein
MKILRHALIALLSVAVLATGAARAASTTNYSDQWWNSTESGWGAAVLQQADVLFIDLFVYGTDGRPTWFVATVYLQPGAPAGHDVFTGDLYAATGPYFGGPFSSAPFVPRRVGTLTFDASSGTTATMTYTVDGTRVDKTVTRQPLRGENIGGSYIGGWIFDQTSCTDVIDNGRYEIAGILQFNHSANNAVAVTVQIASATQNGAPLLLPPSVSFTLTGTYTQSGHMGLVQGRSAITVPGEPPDTATVSLFEIERTISGISGRTNSVDDRGGCRSSGRFGGVRR